MVANSSVTNPIRLNRENNPCGGLAVHEISRRFHWSAKPWCCQSDASHQDTIIEWQV